MFIYDSLSPPVLASSLLYLPTICTHAHTRSISQCRASLQLVLTDPKSMDSTCHLYPLLLPAGWKPTWIHSRQQRYKGRLQGRSNIKLPTHSLGLVLWLKSVKISLQWGEDVWRCLSLHQPAHTWSHLMCSDMIGDKFGSDSACSMQLDTCSPTFSCPIICTHTHTCTLTVFWYFWVNH